MTFFKENITSKLAKLAVFGLAFAFTSHAYAAPLLKSTIKVSSAIVTVGDMFDNAGINAERALFRSPAPGTTGSVDIKAIRLATSKAGIKDFENNGLSFVSVERLGVLINVEQISSFIISEFQNRGIIEQGVIAEANITSYLSPFYATSSQNPIVLSELTYTPSSGRFIAKFKISGQENTREYHGKLSLKIEMPHLISSLSSGTIISQGDIEMRVVSYNFAKSTGLISKEQIVGMQLKRPTRSGMMLRPSDITKPETVKRSAMVTIYYKKGPLTLTANGQALNSAATGEMVSVLNVKSKNIVQGIATYSGAVEIIITNAKNI